jgi:hypothetical protein
MINSVTRDMITSACDIAGAAVVMRRSRELVSTIRKAAAACNVAPPVIRRWIKRGWLPKPPWTLQLLEAIYAGMPFRSR